MSKKLHCTPHGDIRLEVETSAHRRRHFLLPSRMSPAARLAFLASPRLASILARLEEAGREESEGYVVFALHKLALDLMVRYPASDTEASSAVPAPASRGPLARLVIQAASPGSFVFCTTYKDESICQEKAGASLQDVLALAMRELPPAASAIELSYEGIVSGTYPRHVLERHPELVAEAARHTKETLEETLGPPPASFDAVLARAAPGGSAA